MAEPLTPILPRLALLLLLPLYLPSAALAQGASDSADAGSEEAASAADPESAERTALARALFAEGMEHVQAERFAEGADRFRRANALHPSPNIAFNLAAALARLDRLVEATELLRELLRDGALHPRLHDEGSALLERLLPQIPHLRIRLEGESAAVTVQIDGRTLDAVAIGVNIPIDPGSHEIRALRGGETIASEDVQLGPGERREIALALPSGAGVPPGALEPSPQEGGGGGISPWVWIGAGVGLVLVAAGVVALVTLSGEAEPAQPIPGNTMPAILEWP
ncbi:MAG: hypothetical protein OEY14_08215 [Myxococcales bacterium]|nr:hypothetical protein [Myxococcales bacterium]